MKIFASFAVLALTFLAAPHEAIAQQTDYTCVSDCQQAGYLYSFCKSRCSFDTGNNNSLMNGGGGGILPNPRPRASQTDYQCMSDCRELGYQYRYCQQLCAY